MLTWWHGEWKSCLTNYLDGQEIYRALSITNHYNIEILLSSIAQYTGQYFPYWPVVGAIRRFNSSNTDLQEGQCWSNNWECLYCDSSLDIQWNIAWALRKSLGLRPQNFPRAQAIFHRIYISLLSSQYTYSSNLGGQLSSPYSSYVNNIIGEGLVWSVC